MKPYSLGGRTARGKAMTRLVRLWILAVFWIMAIFAGSLEGVGALTRSIIVGSSLLTWAVAAAVALAGVLLKRTWGRAGLEVMSWLAVLFFVVSPLYNAVEIWRQTAVPSAADIAA